MPSFSSRTVVYKGLLLAGQVGTFYKDLANPLTQSALAMVQLRTGNPSPVVTPEEAAAHPYTPEERALVEAVTADHVIGDPAAVHRGLAALVERTGADELMLSTRAHDLATRVRSLTLVADRWGLQAAAA